MPWTPDGQYIDDGTSSDNAGNDAYTGTGTYNADSDSYWPTNDTTAPVVNGTYDSSSDSYWPTNTATTTPTNNNGGISNMLGSVFGGANGVKTAAAMAGALAGGTGLLDNKTKRSGYQGGIPQ